MNDTEFTVTIDLDSGYAQNVDVGVDGALGLIVDEPPPLGGGSGPNPVRLVAAAVGSCLSASLLFCLRKARVDVLDMHTTVRGTLVRNERGRLRIGSMDVLLEPTVPPEQFERVRACTAVFEDYCVVTATLRTAFPVGMSVVPVAPAVVGATL